GRIRMSLRGRSLQFLADSDQARFQDHSAKLDGPVLLRAQQAFVPVTFFASRDFSDWSRHETLFNPKTRLLSVERSGSVGPVRWFSSPGRTRVALELGPGVSPSAGSRGVSGVQVSVPLGYAAASETGDIGDGLVASYALRQNAKGAALAIKLQKSGAKWKARE